MESLTKDNWGSLFFSLSLCHYLRWFNVSLVCCQWSCHVDKPSALVNRVLVGNTGNSVSHNPPAPTTNTTESISEHAISAGFGKRPSSRHSVMLNHHLHPGNHKHSWWYVLYYLTFMRFSWEFCFEVETKIHRSLKNDNWLLVLLIVLCFAEVC